MKILVTGAGGYLGKGIVNALHEKGFCVIATDRKLDHVKSDQKFECDLFDINTPYQYFEEPDIVLHMAWRDGFAHYSDFHVEDLPRHYKFLKSMAEAGIKKIVGMGSVHEVGFYEGSVKEDTPCNPVTPYGISKNALRRLTEMECNKNQVEFQWLRGFYIVGNVPGGNSIFSKITSAVFRGEKEFPFTQGLNQFDFIDYDDFCNQVAMVVTQNAENGIINICSGRPEKIANRVERFIQDNHYDIKLLYGAFPDRPYDSKAIWGDDRKLIRILGRS